MDFEFARAESKLKRHRGTKAKSGIGGASARSTRPGLGISEQAKRQAALQQKIQNEKAAKRLREQKAKEYQQSYYNDCERKLKIKRLGSSTPPSSSSTANTPTGLLLHPTSIYGEGDKIALPPSVLELLTSTSIDVASSSNSPWTFRIALLNPNYKEFPSSPLIQIMKPPREDDGSDYSDDHSDDFDDDDDDDENQNSTEAYLDELKYKYLSYTHGTVVEFTQEEGQVGLPEPIANALLMSSAGDSINNNNSSLIPVKRTVDPSKKALLTPTKSTDQEGGSCNMDIANDDEEKTPGEFLAQIHTRRNFANNN